MEMNNHLKCISFAHQASLDLCWSCGETITDNIIRALERAYHPSCFTCVTCKQQIGEQPFAQGEVGEVYCLEDYYRYESELMVSKKELHRKYFS